MSERRKRQSTPTKEPTIVILGFASYGDSSFELIVQDKETREETTLKGKLEQGQFEIVDRILPTCVFVYGICKES